MSGTVRNGDPREPDADSARTADRARGADYARETAETRVRGSLCLEPGSSKIGTGIGFLDHLLASLAFHGRFTLDLSCAGDLPVDDHHSVEDCGMALGELVRTALGDRGGIRRFGYAYAPLDESLARAVVDISGRPAAELRLGLKRERIGELATENIPHFLSSFAFRAGITLHMEVLYGDNDHHKAEAAFKALALALRSAWEREADPSAASLKGTLS